jgi:hypothetical protein
LRARTRRPGRHPSARHPLAPGQLATSQFSRDPHPRRPAVPPPASRRLAPSPSALHALTRWRLVSGGGLVPWREQIERHPLRAKFRSPRIKNLHRI